MSFSVSSLAEKTAKITTPITRQIITAFLLALALSGCGLIYKVSIFQGNILQPDDVAQLRPGMSKRQVSLILGTPTVANPFRQNRWDYVGTERINDNTRQKETLTLIFEENQLSEVIGDYTVPEFGLTASSDGADITPAPEDVETPRG